MSKENLIGILNSRKQYINDEYNERDKKIALFEVETLIKIVNKAYNTNEYLEATGVKVERKRTRVKPTRKRKKPSTKGFFEF